MQKLINDIQASFTINSDYFAISKERLQNLKLCEAKFQKIYNDMQTDEKADHSNQNIFGNEISGQSIILKNDPFEEEYIEQEKDITAQLGSHLTTLNSGVNRFKIILYNLEKKYKTLNLEKDTIN